MPAELIAKSSVSVPMSDGRHQVFDAGDTVVLEETDDHFQQRWSDDDPWLANLFEKRSGKSEDGSEAAKIVDPALHQEGILDEMRRERAAYPVEERIGSGLDRSPHTDMTRTRPDSGVDVEADLRFAAIEGADTSDAVPAEKGEAEDMTGDDVARPQVSDLPRVGDLQPVETDDSGAASAGSGKKKKAKKGKAEVSGTTEMQAEAAEASQEVAKDAASGDGTETK